MSEVVFFSNYLNHHQLSFCEELVMLTDNNFYFVAQKAISEKRIAFGYQNITEKYPFVVKTYKSEAELKKAYGLAIEADYVLFGSSNTDYLAERLKNNQLTLKYSERLFKKKLGFIETLKGYRRVYINHTRYKRRNLYMLCASAYAAYDFNRFGAYRNKTFKWAYFPTTKHYDIDELIRNKENSGKIKLLWAGRLIEWKHPECCIEVARRLKEDNIDYELNIVGNGVMEAELKALIDKYELGECVHMLGSMPPDDVRRKMEEANIFLFTSNMQEGWGAVLNEAMNSGCACIASHAIGSAGFLIEHGENGFVYRDDDMDDLYEKVRKLVDNTEIRLKIYINAYKTITELWNAEEAARRFLILCECLENGKDTPFVTGPCSRAVSIGDDKMYEYLTGKCYG